MPIIKKLLLLFLIIFSIPLIAQVALPHELNEKLERMDLSITTPVEQSFKIRRIRLNDYLIADHIIRLRKKKVEIQYKLLPQSSDYLVPPNIQYSNLVSSLASNEANSSLIAIHDIPTATLTDKYKADWGSIAYFEPKASFSKYRYAKLLSIYKSGKGMAYVLFLFDKPDADDGLSYFEARFDLKK